MCKRWRALWYYGRAVAIATQQASPTDAMMGKIKQLLDFVASQEEAVLTYWASDMVLAVHSNASYLNETKACSRAGGHFFLTSDVTYPPNNGAILDIAQIIDAVMSSTAEVELGALFINAREAAVHIWRILAEMGHPQPKMPIQTDTSMAEGVINLKIQPKRTKSMDMRFEWLKDREAKINSDFTGEQGKLTLLTTLQNIIRRRIIATWGWSF
jgi:hypothetical protein